MPDPNPSRETTNACTCGHEDSDGRGDVLACPVHGVGPTCDECGHFVSDCICDFVRDEWPTHHANPEARDA